MNEARVNYLIEVLKNANVSDDYQFRELVKNALGDELGLVKKVNKQQGTIDGHSVNFPNTIRTLPCQHIDFNKVTCGSTHI